MAEIQSNLVDLTVVYSKLNAQLDENISRLNAGAVAVENYNKKISTVPSQFQKALVDIKQKTDAVATSTNSLMQAEKKANQERVKELQLQKQREVAIDKYNNQLAREQAKLEKASNLYNKTQQQLNVIQNAYNNLAVKKERYNNLTSFEENRLKTLQVLTEKYNGTLKTVDATIGKHTRNVGNYAGTFNPLNNSIAQLGREMPAFANSVQTGFMAISNNLPIFFDAMGQVIAQNKQLQAEGKPTQSALMQLAGAFFSFQTLLSVGVTLLTLYGKEMVNFITGSEDKKKAIEAEKKAIEEKQKAEEQAFQTTASFQSDELSKSKILFENAKNLSLSYKERLKAVTELKNRYPEYLKNLSNEQILAGQTADAEERLNTALIGRGYALAAQQLLQTNIEKELALRLKNASNEEKLLAYQQEMFKKGANDIIIYTDRKKRAEQQKESFAKEARKAQSDAYKEQVRELRLEREAIMAQYNEYSKYLGVVNETSSAKRKLAKEQEKLAKFGTEEWLQNEISRLEDVRSKTQTTSEGYREIGGAIAFYSKWLETLTGVQKKSNEETEKITKYGTIEYYEKLINVLREQQQAQVDNNQEFAKIESQIKFYQDLINGIKGVSEETEKATEKNTAYFDSFIDSFSSESGFSKLLDIFRGNIKDFGKDAKTTALAISEAFQEAFNTIANASQANFDAEYTRLEMQKENSLRFAGDSATAREEIERQAEEKRKAIARREAEAQKRLAIFNAIIDTSQAVVAALPNIPLSVAIGVIGAAQIALIASQQIPQFWMGGEHDGGLMMVNDGKGSNYRETIVTPDGKIEKPTGRNVIMNRPKGTQIFTHDQWNEVINKQLSNAGIQPMRSTIETISQQNSLTTDDFNAGISKLAKSMQSNKGGNTQVYLNNKPINTDYFKGKNV